MGKAVARAAISRGQAYLVRLDLTLGSEIKKTRPCVVVSPDELNDRLRTGHRRPDDHKRARLSVTSFLSVPEQDWIRRARSDPNG